MKQAMQVLTSQNTDDWYTPPEYIILVHRMFNGAIDLDPASCAAANQIVNAKLYYDEAFDGLARPWYGNVFLNPPYGKSNGKSSQEAWTNKMIVEYHLGHVSQGIALINSANGYRWYEDLWVNYPVCCVRERIRFINATSGVQGGPAKKAQTFVYFGPYVDKFADVFDPIGRVLLPERGDS